MPDGTEVAIAIEGLVKTFGDVRAVDGVTLAIPRGSIFGLLGRNGAGKTTTLECCVGLARPTSGSVRVLGLDPSRKQDLALLRRRFGVQLQATSLPEKARVAEILELYGTYYGVRVVPGVMEARVGLDGKGDRFVGKLSGGEQQRLALAIALQHDPEIVFLDEPTAGMDAFGRRILFAEVERLKAAGKTVVLTTHYIEEAERMCDEIAVVQRGRIVARGTTAELIARSGGDAAIEFRAGGFTPSEALLRLGRWSTGPADEARFAVAVHGEPGAALAAIVAEANGAGCAIEALNLRRPGLEDAFLAITGEALDDAAPALA